MKLILAMIVKNEEKTIASTLKSCSTIIDKAYICDTGSTDNTIKIMKEQLDDIEVWQEPFEDFGTNRNKVLARIEEKEPSDSYILWLDANDVLVNPKALLKYLTKNPEFDVYNLRHEWDDIGKKLRYISTRLIKNNKIHKWYYKVHEVLTQKPGDACSMDKNLVPDFYVYQDRDVDYNAMGENKSRPRFSQDYEILLKAHEKDPEDMRSLYYLGQTLFFMERFEESKKYCLKRFQNKDPDEETYQAMLRYAKCCCFLSEDFEKTEKVLLEAHNMLKKIQEEHKQVPIVDIEPLAIIMENKLQKGKNKEAFELAKEIASYPVPSLQLPVDVSIYNYKRWLILAMLCEEMKDEKLGYTACNQALASTEAKAANDYYQLQHPKTFQKNLMNQVSNLHILRKKFETLLDSKFVNVTTKPHTVIYAGPYYRKWNGKSINTTGLGGAETAAVKVAEELVKNHGHHVVIFADTDERCILNGVEYLRLSDYLGYVSTHHINTLIVQRYGAAIQYGHNIKSVYLWLQDVDMIGEVKADPSLKGIITLCQSHADYLKKKIAEPFHPLIKIIGNAIDPERFTSLKYPTQQNKFIYSSCPTRGLHTLVNIFPDIIKLMPDAQLHIYSDFDNAYVESQPQIVELGKYLKTNKATQIYFHGRVSQEKLAQEIKKSDFWLYPTSFTETYCITALEMMAGGAIPICSKLWALSELVNEDKGYLLHSATTLLQNTDETKQVDSKNAIKLFKEEVLTVLSKVKNDKEVKRLKATRYAQEQTWASRAKAWNLLIN